MIYEHVNPLHLVLFMQSLSRQFLNLYYTRLFKAYRNDPMFSDTWVWEIRADPDQTAPRGSPLFAIPFASF